MLFIYLIVAFKARSHCISSQNISETAQNHARSFENINLAHPAITMLRYRRIKNWKLCPFINLGHFEGRGQTSLQCPTCGQQLEIVIIRNALQNFVSSSKFAFFPTFSQATPSYDHQQVWLTESLPTKQSWLIFTYFVPFNRTFGHLGINREAIFAQPKFD